MAATNAPVLIDVGLEGNLQTMYFTISAVANNTTTDFSAWSKNIISAHGIPSTSAGVGSTISAGVVTWLISTGTPNLVVRLVCGQ
jgi:hypothetical protein